MFHHIDALRTSPTLVRTTDFVYDEDPVATKLIAVSQTGYVWDESAGSYTSRSLPPMEFAFSEATISASIQDVSQASLVGLPAGAVASVQWVDLEGEGLPGMLVEQEGPSTTNTISAKGNLALCAVWMPNPICVQGRGG